MTGSTPGQAIEKRLIIAISSLGNLNDCEGDFFAIIFSCHFVLCTVTCGKSMVNLNATGPAILPSHKNLLPLWNNNKKQIVMSVEHNVFSYAIIIMCSITLGP